MAGRGATTFQKRQKEQLRKEKREAKQSRRQQKKLDVNTGGPEMDDSDPFVEGDLNAPIRTDIIVPRPGGEVA